MKRFPGLLLFAIYFLLATTTSAHAGYWKLEGQVFSGQDEWASGDWVQRVVDRSPGHIVVTNSARGGHTSKTVNG